eukprot:5857158-Amphidinium_carterae.1
MCSRWLCLTHSGAAIARTIPGKANLNSLEAGSTTSAVDGCPWAVGADPALGGRPRYRAAFCSD